MHIFLIIAWIINNFKFTHTVLPKILKKVFMFQINYFKMFLFSIVKKYKYILYLLITEASIN